MNVYIMYNLHIISTAVYVVHFRDGRKAVTVDFYRALNEEQK